MKNLLLILALAVTCQADAGIIALREAATDNTVTLSNGLKRGASQSLPPGSFTVTNETIITGTVNLVGNGTTIHYSLPAGKFALKFTGANSTVEGIRFVDANATASTNVGAIFLNAVGFPKVERCEFVNVGAGVYVSGDANISYRSNHWSVSYNTFSNFFSGIVCANNNQAQYGIVQGNRGSICRGGDALLMQGANMTVVGNNFNGWQDSAGGYGAVVGAGLTFLSDNGFGHSIVVGNTFNHFARSLVISNITGSVLISQNAFMGSASNRISNCTGLILQNNLFDTYDAGNGTRMTNCPTPIVFGNFLLGTVIGFDGYVGQGNWLFNYGPSTNDYTFSPRGGVVGVNTFSRTTAYPSGFAERITTGAAINGAILTDGIIQGSYFVATNGIGYPNSGMWFQGTGMGIKLGSWNGGNDKSGMLEVGQLRVSTNFAFVAAPTGTPGNTATPANYIQITNNGARYFLPAYQ